MIAHGLKYLGLVVPPGLWALNTQLGQILPYADCGAETSWSAISSFTAVAVSLAAAFLSVDRQVLAGGRNAGFVSWISVLAALLFAVALTYQGAASLLVDPCQR